MKKKIWEFILALAFVAGAFFMPANARASTVYKGADVYRYTNITDYQALKNTGTSVLIQKATEGLTYTDRYLNYRAVTAPKYGFKIGYYHFAGNNSPIAEAQHFLSAIRGLHLDTVLWLDIEQPPKSYGWAWGRTTAVNYANQFIKYVQSQGYKIGVYSGQSFYYDYLQGNIPDVPLWLANYSQQPLQYPNKVSWQYTGTGRINGISTYVDLDYFNDSIFTGSVPTGSNSVVQAKPVVDKSLQQVQHNLNRIMNFGLDEDGINGPKTIEAVTKFQSIMGLQVDGIAGDRTKTAINQILDFIPCQYGSDNFATKYVQYRLHIHVDGKFGVQTRNAVMNYQKTHGLAVNGVTYHSTWQCLFK